MHNKFIYMMMMTTTILFWVGFLYSEIVILESHPQPEYDAQLKIKHHITEYELTEYERIYGKKWSLRPDGWIDDGDEDIAATKYGDEDIAATEYGDEDIAATEYGDEDIAATEYGDEDIAATDDFVWHFPTRNPPDNVFKPVAEFDPMSGVMIRYPLGIPIQLVVALAADCRVVCLVTSSQQSAAVNAFTNAGVNMSNVQFLNAPTDSYWTRDFGPWFSFSGDGTLNVIAFTYNRPRPNDNLISTNYYAPFDTLTAYHMQINHCGGNYMADGYHTAMSTNLVLSENGNNQTLVRQRMLDYLGVENYHIRPDPNSTYIDHIDCWGKLLTPDKILIRSVPTTHPQYNAIEQAAAYFTTQISAYGRPYEVVRVYTPNNQPYTNSLILNHKVFVPIMNTNPNTNDLNALAVYQNAMPGYTIVGVPNSTGNAWINTDALHCRTKELADRRVIYLEHIPLALSMDWQPNVSINATVASWTGQPLATTSPEVIYKLNDTEWQSIPMTPHPQYDDDFVATITDYVPGDTLRYYIQASDINGKTFTHPYIGATMAHKVTFTPDMTPPVILHNPITEINAYNLPVDFVAQVTDNVGVENVMIAFYTNLHSDIISETMSHISDDIYVYTLDFPLTDVETLYYRLTASDISNPQNITTLPPAEWFVVSIINEPPIDTLAPMIVHTPPTEIHIDDFPYEISAIVTDSTGVECVTITYYGLDGLLTMHTDTLEYIGDDVYTITLEVTEQQTGILHYRLEAYDFERNHSAIPSADTFFEIPIDNGSNIDDEIVPPTQMQLSIYPNPLRITENNRINVHLTGNKTNTINITLYNVKGQRISTNTYPLEKNRLNTLSIDINKETLANGIYFIRFDDSRDVVVKKILVIK